ncbi:MAG: sigma factor-like helix-turn-helix DNA-binding protein [Patescibacteria group bacterium]
MATTLDTYRALIEAIFPDADTDTSNIHPDRVQETLKSLSTREQTILAIRFGLKDEPRKSLQETAKKFNVTRERIRQIENATLRKLRVASLARLLTDPLPPVQTTKQAFWLEWTTDITYTSRLIAVVSAENMGKNGWRIPTPREIRSAITERTAGFTQSYSRSCYWTASENKEIGATAFKVYGKVIEEVPNKTRAMLVLVRTISQSGRLVD